MRIVGSSQTYCFAHNPDKAERRKKNARKAGKVKGPLGEVQEIKARIRELAEMVVEGKVDRASASVAFQGYGALRGFYDLERKIKELQEIEARLDALETLQQQATGRRSWGA